MIDSNKVGCVTALVFKKVIRNLSKVCQSNKKTISWTCILPNSKKKSSDEFKRMKKYFNLEATHRNCICNKCQNVFKESFSIIYFPFCSIFILYSTKYACTHFKTYKGQI